MQLAHADVAGGAVGIGAARRAQHAAVDGSARNLALPDHDAVGPLAALRVVAVRVVAGTWSVGRRVGRIVRIALDAGAPLPGDPEVPEDLLAPGAEVEATAPTLLTHGRAVRAGRRAAAATGSAGASAAAAAAAAAGAAASAASTSAAASAGATH